MTDRTTVHGLQVANELHQFINDQVLPGTGVAPETFWQGFDALVNDLAPRNAALLAERDRLQTELDTWHKAHPGPITDMAGYRSFLSRIGYLVEPPQNVQATTRGVDAELATQAASFALVGAVAAAAAQWAGAGPARGDLAAMIDAAVAPVCTGFGPSFP